MIAAPLSAKLVGAVGTKLVVAGGLATVAASLVVLSFADVDSGYGPVALTLVLVGAGMGLAMAPATDSIMGSLPPERAGVGSAVNDTTREIGGALGVAILGSITSATYAASITGHRRLHHGRPGLAGGGRRRWRTRSAGRRPSRRRRRPSSPAAITAAADAAFIDALGRTTIVAAIVALAGAVVALIWLPARADVPVLDLELGVGRGRPGRAGRRRRPVDAGRCPAPAGPPCSCSPRRGCRRCRSRRSPPAPACRPRRCERHWTSKVDAVEGRPRRAVRAAADPRHRRPPGRPGPLPRRPGRAALPPRGPSGDRHPHQGERRGPRARRRAAVPARPAAPRSPRGSVRGRPESPATSPRTRTWSPPPQLVEGGLFYRPLIWGEGYTLDPVVEVLGSSRP